MHLILQHEPGEGPGLLGSALPGARLVKAFEGEPVPEDPRAFDGVAVLGGGMGVGDLPRLPWLRDELALVKRCVELDVPVLGLCLGSQLLAAALGAKVERAPQPELGFYRVRLTATDDALLHDAPADFVAFHWHSDRFELPARAAKLASSTLTPLQAFRHGRAWGLQFHLELDEPLLEAMISGSPEELTAAGVDAESLRAQAARELPRLRPLAAQVFSRWAALR